MSEASRPRISILHRLILALVLMVFYLPLLNSGAVSLTDGGELSGRWYRELAADPMLWQALGRSFGIALATSIVSTILGLSAALAMARWRNSMKGLLSSLTLLSLMLPELVLALSLLSWFATLRWDLGLHTVAIAHITLTLPFASLIIGARLQGLDATYDDVARDLGASDRQIFFKVTLPLLAPALLSALLLSFLLSFDDFLLTFFVNGAGGDTLPVRLYSMMKTGMNPKIQALSSTLFVCTTLLIFVLFQRRDVINAKNIQPNP